MIDYYETKTHPITRLMVWQAYKEVKSNGKAAGVDGVSMEEYAKNLKGNLYKLWNRLTSGSYFPADVREKRIEKKGGEGYRSLGIPTVEDKIAHQVVRAYLEPKAEPTFHADSYGYRPKRHAHDAIAKARERCHFKSLQWVLDLDISKFFDSVDHELMLKAVAYYTKEKWVLMYIERWLKAGVLREDGAREEREKGTPQGGVVSPLLSNIYLHFAFDKWMELKFPFIQFERYCDDIIVHCASENQAYYLKQGITWRLEKCKLQLNQEKTKVVYCKNPWRLDKHPNVSFDFLGYTFCPRMSYTKSGWMMLFSPEMSKSSKNAVMKRMRQWRTKTFKGNIHQMAKGINPMLTGWINYYCAFNKWRTEVIWQRLNKRLIEWVCWKYKKHVRQAVRWLKGVYIKHPTLFAHWKIAHF
jgi:group II intron reverse transcriptase/maturase